MSRPESGGVYSDAHTGGMLGFGMLMIGPGGLTVSPTGDVYVTDFTSNRRIYDPSLASLLDTISAGMGVTSGWGLPIAMSSSHPGSVFTVTMATR